MKKSKKGKKIGVLSHVGHVLAVIGVTLAFILLAALGVIFLLLKGPSPTAKTIFAISCNETSAMKWIPSMFLSDEEYDQIKNSTKMAEVDEGTVSDTSMIDVPQENVSQDIEVQDVVGGSFKGKLMIIHDPSRVFLGTVESFGEFQGEVVQDIAAR